MTHAEAAGAGGFPFSRPAAFPSDELQRYSRHLRLPEVGLEGQQRLRDASVLCVGAGGLGSPTTMYLAAAGVGRLGLVDFDTVDLSNLQRQILHGTPDIGLSKIESAGATLRNLNPGVTLDLHAIRLDESNARDLVEAYDVVVDGSDNFTTRYLVNDACFFARRPCVHGSVLRFEGMLSVFCTPNGPCYRCLYPHPPPPDSIPNCSEAGVLGVLPGVLGCLQATEALKWILGAGNALAGRLLLYDALAMTFREVALRRDPSCPLCGDHPSITSLEITQAGCAAQTGAPSRINTLAEWSPEELKQHVDAGETFTLLDVREPFEAAICSLPNSTLIPLAEVPARVGEVPKDRPVVVYCLSGGRSAQAADFLLRSGHLDVINLAGGIKAWAQRVDPGLPMYG